jgi:hypothetical protein
VDHVCHRKVHGFLFTVSKVPWIPQVSYIIIIKTVVINVCIRHPAFKFEDLMAQSSTTCMLGLEMANPASSQGMIKVLQSFQPLVPVVNEETGARQFTVVFCDQNFYERGML